MGAWSATCACAAHFSSADTHVVELALFIILFVPISAGTWYGSDLVMQEFSIPEGRIDVLLHDNHHYVREVAAIALQFVMHRSARSVADIGAALVEGIDDNTDLETKTLNAAALIHLLENRKADREKLIKFSARTANTAEGRQLEGSVTSAGAEVSTGDSNQKIGNKTTASPKVLDLRKRKKAS